MNNRMYLLPLLLVTFLYSCNQHEETFSPQIIAQLDSAEAQMMLASTNGDSAAFRKICGTDYFTIDANGESHNLEQTLPGVPRFKGSVAKLSEQHQRIFGNFALRNGRAKFYMGPQQVAEVLYSTGWIYRDGRWQYVHWQGTLTGFMLEPLKKLMPLEPQKQ